MQRALLALSLFGWAAFVAVCIVTYRVLTSPREF